MKHSDNITFHIPTQFYVNVCSSCGHKFVLLSVHEHEDGIIHLPQVGNKLGLLSCPYCKETLGQDE